MASSNIATNSIILTTSQAKSRSVSRNSPSKLTIFAKNSGPFPSFRPTKSSNDESSSTEDGSKKTSNPFRFDFGNLSDIKSLIPVVSNPAALGALKRKDPGTVFVAGATGQAGVRIAQTLLREGFRVRAGVPDLGAAQELARFASTYKLISDEESRRLNAVESEFEDAESIAKAIGNASKLVITIGPSENGPTEEVTTSDAVQVVEAAQLAGVSHVAIVYDEAAMTTSTYNVLDGISSFFNNLLGKSKPLLSVPEFMQKLIETDVRYTFIKTRLGDDFLPERSYNLAVAEEGNAASGTNEYKVTRATMASLVADLFANTAVAENKVVEVYVDPSAPSRSVDELFSLIPEDGRRKAYADAIAKAKAEEAAVTASEKAREAAEAAKKLEEEVQKLSQQEAQAAAFAEDAKQKAETAGASAGTILNKAKDFSSGLSWEKLGSQFQAAIPKGSLDQITTKVQIATVRGQAKAQNLPAQKAAIKQPKYPVNKVKEEAPRVKERADKAEEPKGGEVRNIFGGLFKQDTIYVDDD